MELVKEGLDKVAKTKLNKELNILETKVELFTAELFIGSQVAKQDAELDALLKISDVETPVENAESTTE